jgi:dolichol-phosphate mannosyltransferase
MKKISIVLPTYNEAENIQKLIYKIQEILVDVDYEIIVIDDNSNDCTYQKVIEMRLDNVFAYKRVVDRGLAKSIRLGLDKSVGKYICVMDADFSHNPTDILNLLEKLAKYDIVWGSRFIKGGGMAGEGKKIQKILSFILNRIIIKSLLKVPVNDTTNGFYIIRKKIYEELIEKEKIFYGYGDYSFRLSYFLNKAGRLQVECPVIYDKRLAGSAKTKLLTVGSKYIKEAIKLLINDAK